VAHDTIAQELGRTGLGRLQVSDWVNEDLTSWPPNLEGGHHHLGTARMSESAAQGVVDRHCRLHGVDNLYVAGSAVFPTVGYANPTLTIVALALRSPTTSPTRRPDPGQPPAARAGAGRLGVSRPP
jgi:choline dehydrogenase-like flavoprotein